MRNPDKWIRKYFFETLNNLSVGGATFKVYDSVSTAFGSTYIILSTQSKSENYEVKCGMRWDCDIILDIVTIFTGKGSRLLVDDASEKVVDTCNNILIEHFDLINKSREYPNEFIINNGEQTIFRKLIKYNLKLKENGS